MNKITMGRTRKKSKAEDCGKCAERSRTVDAVFVLGTAAVCVMLALPMLNVSSPEEDDAAVMVMSGAVEPQTMEKREREELIAPSNTEMEEEWSFYDYIGELFAGLLSGQS